MSGTKSFVRNIIQHDFWRSDMHVVLRGLEVIYSYADVDRARIALLRKLEDYRQA
jgi:hypothetical protein